MGRGDLNEAEWRVLKDLLPTEPLMRGRGRRPTENRAVLNGILWRLRCGAPWRDVPEKYGKWNTICRRFRTVIPATQRGETRLFQISSVALGGISGGVVCDSRTGAVLCMVTSGLTAGEISLPINHGKRGR